jgi:hypothetical protein
MAELIDTGQSSTPLDPFTIARFAAVPQEALS